MAAAAAAPTGPKEDGVIKKCCDKVSTCIKDTPIERILKFERGLNVINGGLLMCSSVFGFMALDDGQATQFFLCIYVGCFSLMLLTFELRVARWEQTLRRLFGFMYSDYGRACFLLFVGTINFGITHDVSLTVGILTILNFCFNCFVMCSHPEFKKRDQTGGVKETSDPDDLGDDAVVAYLKAHPEVAQAALDVESGHIQPAADAGSPFAPSPVPAAPVRATAPPAPAVAPAAPVRAAPPPVPAHHPTPVTGVAASGGDENPFDTEENPFK